MSIAIRLEKLRSIVGEMQPAFHFAHHAPDPRSVKVGSGRRFHRNDLDAWIRIGRIFALRRWGRQFRVKNLNSNGPELTAVHHTDGALDEPVPRSHHSQSACQRRRDFRPAGRRRIELAAESVRKHRMLEPST